MNLALGAGHVFRKPIYFTLSKATLSHTFWKSQLSQLTTVIDSLTATQQSKMGELSQRKHFHSHIEISIFTIFQVTKLLINFNIAYYIHTHAFKQQAGTYFADMYFLVFMRTYTHTHVYISMTLPLSLSVLTANTQICSNDTHYHSANICNIHIHTHTHIYT